MVSFDSELSEIIKKSKYWCTNIFETNELSAVHVLYTLLKDEANIVYNVFWEMGVDIELFSEELKKIAITGKQTFPTNKIHTSKILEQVFAHALKNKSNDDIENKQLTLSDITVSIIETKTECSAVLKNHEINKKNFLEIYNSFLSYDEGMMALGYMVNDTQKDYGESYINSAENYGVNTAQINDKSALNKYCRNISKLAKSGELKKISGRENEINKCLEVLNKNEKKNILLIGEAGVGKTSIVEGLANKTKNSEIYELDLNKLVAGTKFRGDLEKRLDDLLNSLRKNSAAILFIDEAHALKNAGASDDGLSLINTFKPPMARGEIRLILATTNKDYTLYLENDKALGRRCTIIQVDEPDKNTTLLILKSFAEKYKFSVSKKLLNDIYSFSQKHVLNKHMPDKALDILDMCHAKAKIKNEIDNLVEVTEKLENLISVKNELFSQGNLELSEQIYTEEKRLNEILTDEKNKVKITEDILKEVLNENYNYVGEIEWGTTSFKKDVTWFKNELVGQDNNIEQIIKRYYGYNLNNNNKPFNYFLLGNSGMGKTRTAELFAEKYYNSNILVINCPEYNEAHSISNLIGSPAGYIRSDEGGLLVNYVDKHPNSVILFDEIEEAHQDVYSLLLQILDRGLLTDRKNLKANFMNCAIFFTSNIGVKEASNIIGFNKDNSINENFFNGVLAKKFEKKFLNRIDNFSYFNNLNENDYGVLFDKKINEIRKKMRSKISIRININTKKSIISQCINNHLGVRQLNKLINDKVYNIIIDAMLKNLKNITI